VAGDWIKLEHATLDKPEVLELSELLSVSQGDALLYCLRFWVWVDEQSRDGRLIGRSTAISKKSIDALMHCAGFANALIHVGWLEEHEGVLCIPKFDAHNGETSKKRVLKNRAQANWRESKVGNVDTSVDSDVDKTRSTKASTREEKRRSKNISAFALPDWVPADAWEAWEEVRKKKRSPLTDRARQLAVAELQRLRDGGHDPRAVIERAVLKGWLSFYPPNVTPTPASAFAGGVE
jgi:hypothetical protein